MSVRCCSPAKPYNRVVAHVFSLILPSLSQELVGAEQKDAGKEQQNWGEVFYELCTNDDHQRAQHSR